MAGEVAPAEGELQEEVEPEEFPTVDWPMLARRSEQAAGAVLAGDVAAMEEPVAPELRLRLGGRVLREISESLQEHGAFEALGMPRLREDRELIATRVPIFMQRRALTLEVWLEPEGRILDLRIVHTAARGAARPVAEYVDLEAFSEVDVSIHPPGGQTLRGTLAMPEGPGPFPAALVVPPLWPADLSQHEAGVDVPRDLAQALASRGVAALRYDPAPRPEGMTLDMSMAEMQAALQALRDAARVDLDSIYVIGHGLSGRLVPEMVGDAPVPVAGVVLAAVPARGVMEALLGEAGRPASLDEPALALQQARVDELLAARAAMRAGPLEGQALSGLALTEWERLNASDPAAALAGLLQDRPGLRALVLLGGQDARSGLEDAAVWQDHLADSPAVKLRLYPQMDYVLTKRAVPGSRADYTRPEHVSRAVAKEIARWMHPAWPEPVPPE